MCNVIDLCNTDFEAPLYTGFFFDLTSPAYLVNNYMGIVLI